MAIALARTQSCKIFKNDNRSLFICHPHRLRLRRSSPVQIRLKLHLKIELMQTVELLAPLYNVRVVCVVLMHCGEWSAKPC